MSSPTSACCVVVLNQQQEQNIYHHNQTTNEGAPGNYGKSAAKSCTVVEEGQVVVRPSRTPLDKASE
jgi:hypothetical protein